MLKPWPPLRRQPAQRAPPSSHRRKRRGRLRGWTLREPRLRRRSRGSATCVSRWNYEVGKGGRTYQIVTEKLHDEGGVLVALLREGVELCDSVSNVRVLAQATHTGNSVVESLLGELASLVGRVQDLVVEHGEVQRKTEADGVGGGQAAGSDLGGGLVRLERLVGRGLALVADGELGEVAVVVTLPGTRSVCVLWQPRSMGNLTSYGRTPWTRRSRQKESSARRGTRGCPRRSGQARPRSSGGTP